MLAWISASLKACHLENFLSINEGKTKSKKRGEGGQSYCLESPDAVGSSCEIEVGLRGPLWLTTRLPRVRSGVVSHFFFFFFFLLLGNVDLHCNWL